MKGYDLIIKALKEDSPLADLYKWGYTYEEIKHHIENDFSLFFDNKEKLHKYLSSNLISDWIHYSRIKDTYFTNKILEVLLVYREAKSRNGPLCFQVIQNSLNQQLEGGNRFWRLLHLEQDKEGHDLQEFVQLIMNEIGNITEGLFKIFSYEYLAINRIKRGKFPSYHDVSSLDFGVVINELAQTSIHPDLFLILSLKISDWRNIASHQDFRIKDEKIVCEYGPKKRRSEIIINKDQLEEVYKLILKSLYVFNLAHKFFCYENEDHIYGFVDSNDLSTEPRVEIWFLILASGITAQGFEILDFVTNNEFTKIVIKDLIESDFKKRAAHATQFLYNLWYYSSSEQIQVVYHLKNGKPYLAAETTSSICERIGKKEEDLSYLAEKMKISFL